MSVRVITNSELSALFSCPKKHQFSYERLLRPKKRITALDEGSAGHNALEAFYKGASIEDAIKEFDKVYDAHVEAMRMAAYDEHESIERFLRVRAALLCYLQRVGMKDKEKYRFDHVEQEFRVPIFDPDGKEVPGVIFAGKIDGLWTPLESGQKMVVEHKFLSAFEETRNNLTIDMQVTLYALAARTSFGVEVPITLYNVVRKPRYKMDRKEKPDDFFWRAFQKMDDKWESNCLRAVVTRSPEDFKRAREMLYGGAMILSGRSPLPYIWRNVGMHCNFLCSYRELCKDENNQALAESLYVRKEKRHMELGVKE